MGNAEKPNSKVEIFIAALKMALATFASRILGLIRDQVMAALFGASGTTDAYLLAFRIPNMLRDLFAEGVFSSAFVPIFTEIKQRDEQEAKRLLWSLVLILTVVTGAISLLIMVFAPQVVGLIAPNFTEDADKFQLTVLMLRLMAPFLTFVSLAAVFMGVLNTLKIFFIPSLAPAFFNVVMIVCLLTLPNLLQQRGIHGAVAMALGVIGGGLIQLLIQLPLIFKRHFGPTGPINIFSTHIKRVINRIGIGTIGVASTQINVLVNTIIASSSGVGAISWLNYAFRLFQFPVGVLSVSIAGSNLVHFSEAWKKGDRDRAISYLQFSYLLSLLVMIPSCFLLYSLSAQTIHLIFERGQFVHAYTLKCSGALEYYLFGLPFYGFYKIFGPTLYAMDRPKQVVLISICSITVNIVFCIICTPLYGFEMLALGVSLSMFINSSAQGFYLKKLLALPWSFFINLRVFKIIISGVVCFVLVQYLASNYFDYQLSFMTKIVRFCMIGSAGAGIYLIMLLIMGEYKLVRRSCL